MEQHFHSLIVAVKAAFFLYRSVGENPYTTTQPGVLIMHKSFTPNNPQELEDFTLNEKERAGDMLLVVLILGHYAPKFEIVMAMRHR